MGNETNNDPRATVAVVLAERDGVGNLREMPGVAAQTATPTKNMDDWLDRSRLVNAAEVKLRALVDPQGAKDA